MKILSATQMAYVDAMTCEDQQITSLDLMERAAHTVFLELKNRYPNYKNLHFTIICGKGNNGGDGLVLARLLQADDANVTVYLLKSDSYSTDNLINQKRMPSSAIQLFSASDHLDIVPNTIIIDGLFGYGLRKSLDEKWRDICDQVNRAEASVYALDMPSGLLSEVRTAVDVPFIHADLVYTFQFPKLSLLMPQNQFFYDEFQVLDIQLSKSAIAKTESQMSYVDKQLILSFYRRRKRFQHKGNFGHVLLIGGSKGKMGAIQLALKAALRSGCGLVTTYIPSDGNTIIQTAVPEAMVLTDEHSSFLTRLPAIENYQAVGIGVGMGTAIETTKALSTFLRSGIDKPMIIDADALNILSEHPELWMYVPKNSILTPHPKELGRIVGTWDDDWEKLEKVKKFAVKHQVHVLIKGANSVMLTADEKIYFNSTGNVGMATGGSGDVLTGILTALLGQGYPADQALLLGVFIHGRAADIAVQSIGTYSLLPSDIICSLPQAFLELENCKKVI